MSHPAKQQSLESPEIPETASLCADSKLLKDAIATDLLTASDRLTLLDAWDHAMDWKDAHTLWFRHTPEVERILDRIAAMAMAKEKTK